MLPMLSTEPPQGQFGERGPDEEQRGATLTAITRSKAAASVVSIVPRSTGPRC